MEIILTLKGFIIGFVMAIPIGPMGVMCISKTLNEGRLRGIIIGLGAATADLLYSCIAAFGLSFIANTINGQRTWIRLIGGILLLLLGIKTFKAKPKNQKIKIKTDSLLGLYFYVLLLTLTNPLTIFVFLAVFSELGLDSNLSIISATLLVYGIFLGSFLWFLVLNTGATLFRKKFNFNGLRWVNMLAGVFIVVSGIAALASIL